MQPISRSVSRLVLGIALLGPPLLCRADSDFYSTGPGVGGPDGMCDVWQQVYQAWGLNPADDEDFDGCTNLTESIAGTDPRNPGDCMKVGSTTVAGSNVVLNVMTEAGKRYQLQSNSNPTGSDVTWTNEGAPLTGTGANMQFVAPMGGGANQKFYRVVAQDQDTDSDGLSDWAENETGTDPAVGGSPTNASGGVANDGDTMRSLLSLSAVPVSGYENGYEVADKSAGSPAPSPAKVAVVRNFGTMPLTIPVTGEAGAPDLTKSSASPGDYTIAAVSGGNITIPANAGVPGSPYQVTINPQQDAEVEVPEYLKVTFSIPGGAPVADATVCVCDADPAVEENRTLYVAFLGREAGVATTATGLATALVEGDNDGALINVSFSNLTSSQNTCYVRIGSDLEVINVGLGQVNGKFWQIRAAQTKVTDQAMLTALKQGELYVSITTAENPQGEIRGYFNKASGSTTFTPNPLVHDAPAYPSSSWPAPVADEIERDIYRFLEQCTYGPTTELYTEVRAEVDAAMGGGGTILDGYSNWLDKQMDLGQTPNPSLVTLVQAADNEEFVLRGNKPITSGNDPQFGASSNSVSYDAFGNPIINPTANSTYNNNHPFHNTRRREMWTLALQCKAQVRQRMTQALSEIVVISAVDGTVQSKHYGAAAYWDMLANNAFGKYRTILENVTYHPMMGIYLSHLRNRAEYVSGGVTISPDENYAREIMQLFSIGLVLRHPDGSLVLDSGGLPVATYDNTDITELARVMTGLCAGYRHKTRTVQRFNGLVTYNTSPRVDSTLELNTVTSGFNTFNEGGGDSWWQAPWMYPMKMIGRIGSTVYHDFGSKVLLNTYNGGTAVAAQALPGTGTSNDLTTHTMAANDLVIAHNLLAGNPSSNSSYNGHQNTPVNISRWLIQRLTSSNPSAGYIYRVSEVYRNTNGNLGQVLKAILLDYEARSLVLADSGAGTGRAKEPLVHFMAMLRSLRAFTGIPLTTLRDVPLPFAVGESPLTTSYPQSEVNKFQVGACRFRFGDYSSLLGQSPLRAPSVFNWFLPDYVVPGAMAEAGLFAPEFQINTETNVVNRVNRLWTFTWANLVGMTTFPGAGVDDVTQVVTNAAPEVKVSPTVAGSANSNSFLGEIVLTFTPANWNTPQNVTVAAVDDAKPEGLHFTNILHSCSSTDPAYNAVSLPALPVSVNDNEAGGNSQVVITESAGETFVVEGGATDTYTVQLASAPTADVTVNITPATTNFGTYTADVSVSPASVTFTSANWNSPVTVTVTAVNDTNNEGPEVGMIGHSVVSADVNYAQANVAPVYATVADNENNGSNAISILQTANSTLVMEGGATDEYRVTLRRVPTSTVTVTISGGSQVTTSPTSLTFTTGNWNLPQKVSVTAVDDALIEGGHSQVIANASSGGGYTLTSNVTASITDNDGGTINLVQTGGSTSVTESSPSGTSSNPVIPSGNLDSYTIALASPPTGNVSINVTPQRHPVKMSNWAKLNNYYIADTNGTNSNQQKDSVILDYSEIIAAYTAAYYASPGATGTSPSSAFVQAAHFAGTLAAIDKLDLLLATGQLRAKWPSLVLADLTNEVIVNPRKSIAKSVFNAYSITRHKAPSTTNASWDNEVRDRCRIAAYLTSISPQSMVSK